MNRLDFRGMSRSKAITSSLDFFQHPIEPLLHLIVGEAKLEIAARRALSASGCPA